MRRFAGLAREIQLSGGKALHARFDLKRETESAAPAPAR